MSLAAPTTGPRCREHHEPMLLRRGRTGGFYYGCARYPACRETVAAQAVTTRRTMQVPPEAMPPLERVPMPAPVVDVQGLAAALNAKRLR
jgi:ssDNA-binding Zn-finger/Zn-ribbon topoisomerase 1